MRLLHRHWTLFLIGVPAVVFLAMWALPGIGSSFVMGLAAAGASAWMFKQSSNPNHPQKLSRKFVRWGFILGIIAAVCIAVPAFVTSLPIIGFGA